MNYESEELLEQLSGAYVLGTLRGPARLRFERLCVDSPAARQAQQRWEERFMPLLASLTPQSPRPEVWARIARRVGAAPRHSWPARTWGWLASAALAACLLVGEALWMGSAPPPRIAQLGTDPQHLQWRVTNSEAQGLLTLVAEAPVISAPDSAYELWALPDSGKAPVSLGLLPRVGEVNRTLTPAQRTALAGAQHLAVSLEPAGGSPTGSPTGPVLLVAPLSRRS